MLGAAKIVFMKSSVIWKRSRTSWEMHVLINMRKEEGRRNKYKKIKKYFV